MNKIESPLIQEEAVEVRFLNAHDVNKVAWLHDMAFPGYFLTALGPEIVKRYYKELINYNKLSVGAFRGGRMIGFIIGGQKIKYAKTQFFRRNLLFCAYRTSIALIRSATVRGGILHRISYVAEAFRSKMKRSTKDSGLQKSDFIVISIAVDPELRGSGIALRMMNEFDEILCMNGINGYRLSVLKDNGRAISFYKKAGMRIGGETKQCYGFIKNLDCTRKGT